MNRQPWDTAERRAQLAKLSELHSEWVAAHADTTPAPGPEVGADAGLHHVDMGASSEALTEFHRLTAGLFDVSTMHLPSS